MIITAMLLWLIETGQSSLDSGYYLVAFIVDILIADTLSSDTEQ